MSKHKHTQQSTLICLALTCSHWQVLETDPKTVMFTLVYSRRLATTPPGVQPTTLQALRHVGGRAMTCPWAGREHGEERPRPCPWLRQWPWAPCPRRLGPRRPGAASRAGGPRPRDARLRAATRAWGRAIEPSDHQRRNNPYALRMQCERGSEATGSGNAGRKDTLARMAGPNKANRQPCRHAISEPQTSTYVARLRPKSRAACC